jgi:membrane fusion protein, heavy metal efflux system
LRQLILLGALFVAAAIAVAIWPISDKNASQSERGQRGRSNTVPGTFRPTKEQWAGFRIEPVRLVSFRPEQVAEGSIAIDEDLTTPVFSPYSGRVIKLIAKLGDHVEAGAPLFAIQASEFVQAQNDLITALAALQTARSQLAEAQTNEKRARSLSGARRRAEGLAAGPNRPGHCPEHGPQRRDRACRGAQPAAHLRQGRQGNCFPRNPANAKARSGHDRNRPHRRRHHPAANRPRPVHQQHGGGASSPVYTIGNLSTVWLIANLRETDAPLMRVGQPVEVHVLALPDRVFRAKISWVAPSIDPNTHRLSVRADVENPDGELKPGMFANFSIITGEAQTTPAVPQRAIVYEGGTARVWVAEDDGTVAARSVRTGQIADGMIEIPAGLSPGEKIVTSGALFIDRAASSD